MDQLERSEQDIQNGRVRKVRGFLITLYKTPYHLFMKLACYTMSYLLDHAIKEKYSTMKINDPLIFLKNAIDWDAFTPLMNDLYHNDTDSSGRPNIPVKTMVKVLFLQSMFNMVD